MFKTIWNDLNELYEYSHIPYDINVKALQLYLLVRMINGDSSFVKCTKHSYLSDIKILRLIFHNNNNTNSNSSNSADSIIDFYAQQPHPDWFAPCFCMFTVQLHIRDEITVWYGIKYDAVPFGARWVFVLLYELYTQKQ